MACKVTDEYQYLSYLVTKQDFPQNLSYLTIKMAKSLCWERVFEEVLILLCTQASSDRKLAASGAPCLENKTFISLI